MRLAGRRALVTGGGRGIGRAIAASLGSAGAEVTILGRNAALLAAAVEAGAASRYVAADVADAEATTAAMASTGVPFDIVVANAGAAETAAFGRSDPALFRRMIDVNLIGAVNVFQAALPAMIEAGEGRLIAIGSTASHRGYAYASAYAAAKHAVLGLVRSLALEIARTGVTANCVCPGYTDTDLVAGGSATIAARTGLSPEQAVAEMVKANPQKRLLHPGEVAAAVLYLAGPEAAGMNGQSIIINGGEF